MSRKDMESVQYVYGECIVSRRGGIIGDECRIMLSSNPGCASEELIST